MTIHSFAHIDIEITDFPELSSSNRLIKKSLDMMKQHLPKLLRYLSRQKVISSLRDYQIEIRTKEQTDEKHLRHTLGIWLQKKKIEKLFLVIIEAVLLPIATVLGLLPGPNIFFYGLVLLFYFHLKAFLSLRRTHGHDLNIVILSS